MNDNVLINGIELPQGPFYVKLLALKSDVGIPGDFRLLLIPFDTKKTGTTLNTEPFEGEDSS